MATAWLINRFPEGLELGADELQLEQAISGRFRGETFSFSKR